MRGVRGASWEQGERAGVSWSKGSELGASWSEGSELERTGASRVNGTLY